QSAVRVGHRTEFTIRHSEGKVERQRLAKFELQQFFQRLVEVFDHASAALSARGCHPKSESAHCRPIFSYSRRNARSRWRIPIASCPAAARYAAFNAALRIPPPEIGNLSARKFQSMSAESGAASGN